ncbi:S-layer homology domain-containing protein [Sporosarcina sp. FSL K6-1522]|uniref:S-layer homology domain-containing protein n=1 Tax=Sporosarcina sp. FSL K6-1522 TaxID=2921554 RepID=UPI00315A7F87
MQAIIPSPLTTRKPLTTLLKEASSNGNHVVAGINASFFHMKSGAPAYLLASDNIVNTYGVLSSGNDEYMSVPSAFGIDRNGLGRIGRFGYEASIQTDTTKKTIHFINKARGTGEIVLYTPSYSYASTRTNSSGMEIVLSNFSAPIEENYRLGTPITATVEKVVPNGNGDTVIPKNGAVLSIQGGAQAAEFANVQAGSQLTLSIDLTEPWQGADFVLASGPLLVQNGKVDMTINPQSSRAKAREPRTAVATNADGSKVFFVTVDGRSTASAGMTLPEFSSYLVSIGAHHALNLDGGGSTTLAVRERGTVYPKVFNNPSDKSQRAVSAVLGAVSYTEVSQPRTMVAKMTGPSVLLPGATTTVQVDSALDSNFHVVPVNKNDIRYSVTGDIGTVSASGVFTAVKAGKGSIVITYGNATQSFPIEVADAPSKMVLTGATGEVGPEDTIPFTVKAYDAANREMAFAPSIIKWSASPELGTIDASGVLKTNRSGAGSVTATIGAKSVTQTLKIISGGKLISSFVKSAEWRAESAKATTTLRFDGSKAPVKDGQTALTLSYDFTANPTGTSASYAVATKPIALPVKPTALGMWVYGDGAAHWLRGTLVDGKGNDVTIDFTKESGLNWTGWRYVKAQLPATIQGPVSLKRIYVAETSSMKKNKGSIYLDRLIAEYGDTHREQPFNDVVLSHWAVNDIASSVEYGWINGYGDGTFKPESNLTRAHAAVLISRALKLPQTATNGLFTDVPASHIYAKEIAAVNKAGIMTGKSGGKFDPNGTLTRAQMAKILVTAYELKAGSTPVPPLKDVSADFWAIKEIQALQANNITVAPDGKFRPNDNVTRAQFAAFMMRANK